VARVYAALGIVYLVWGSTYLAMMVAIRTMPPLLMSSVRFLIAGAVLYLICARGTRPTSGEWLGAAITGGLMLVLGNGGIAWAETRIDSGVAALIVAALPLWMALLARKRLRPLELAGIALGLGGVTLLLSPGGGVNPVGAAVVLVGTLAWAGGSLLAPRIGLPSRPLVAASMQMLTAGILLGVTGISAGETARIGHLSAASLGAFAYLIVFGSILAFTVYGWLLQNAPPTLVSTYAFVNPVVAVALGVVFLHEPVGLATLLAGGAIVGAVVLIVAGRTRKPRPAPAIVRVEARLDQAA